MATYNKRGYKAPKPKEEKLDNTFIEDVNVDEKDSTTAGLFNTLDATASKTEEFVERNQKAIFGIVVVLTLAVLGYFGYNKFVAEPKENDATENMFTAQQNFNKAAEGTKSDSLYKLALNGSEGKYGFLKVADEYSGTKAANLANYYAGLSYLHTKQYDKAIDYLQKFKSDDDVLSVLAVGAIGDAKAEKNDLKGALEQYLKASQMKKDGEKESFTTPYFLLKAGKTSLALNNKADALKYFQQIKDDYSTSTEAQSVEALIGLAQK